MTTGRPPYPPPASELRPAGGQDITQALSPLPTPEAGTTEPRPAFAGREIPLSLYWTYLRKYRWHIATFVVLVTVACTLYALSIPKQYESTALIRISLSGTQVVGSNSSVRQSENISTETLLSTAEQVVQAPSVVLQTIDALQLDQNLAILPAKDRTGLSPAALREKVLRTISHNITVEHPPLTLLLAVKYRASDPQLAAQVANGLAQAFIDHQFQNRLEAIRASSKYMSSQLDDMKAEMERSQKALVDYETQNNVLNPEDKSNVYQSQLNQTNQDLGEAQSQRVKLEATYAAVQAGGLNALLASPRGEVLKPLEDQLREDEAKLQNMAILYGPKHPLYRQQQQVVANDHQQLLHAAQQVDQQLRSEYLAARQRESLLNQLLNQEKLAMDQFNLRAVQYAALKGEAASNTSLYYDLLQRIKEANISAEFHSSDVAIVNQARPELIPVYPRVRLIALLGLFLSTLIGICAAIFAGSMDKTIGAASQIESWLQLPVVGTLPVAKAAASQTLAPADFSPMRTDDDPNRESNQQIEPFREAILSLRSNLLFSGHAQGGLLAITSAQPHEGKSTIAANLAAALAGLSGRTLLIDADLRRPTLHRLFRLPNRAGLSTAMRGRMAWDAVTMPVSGIPGLSLLPSGPSVTAPSEWLLHGLAAILDAARERFDFIVIDCPPVMGFADAAVVCNMVDGALLVANAGETHRDMLGATVQALRRARVNLMGIILNRVSKENGGSYYYGYNYSHYYRNDDGAAEASE